MTTAHSPGAFRSGPGRRRPKAPHDPALRRRAATPPLGVAPVAVLPIAPDVTRRQSVRGLLRLMRPKQWLKNLLVCTAPFAAGRLLEGSVLTNTLIALLAFTLASSSTYCLNDALDAKADAQHPLKSRRPIPSGHVSRNLATGAGAVLAVAALAVAVPGQLRIVIASYLVLTILYSTVLKHQPVIELAFISMGFILRSLAGGVATGVVLSEWFLIVTGFASLFMATGKRLSESLWSERNELVLRPCLRQYSVTYLRQILGISAGVTITGYCLWAFEVAARHDHSVFFAISILPFVLAIMRYALNTDRGAVEEPEEVLLRDRGLQVLGLLWLGTYATGVFW